MSSKTAASAATLAAAGGALFVLLLMLAVGWIFFAAYVLAINVADMVVNGVTFWPVFWCLLVLLVSFARPKFNGKVQL
jgi:hypothetical protein